jgi:hypothetical protein
VQNPYYGIVLVLQEKFDSGFVNHGIDFSPELIPCLKSECDRWDGGECIHIRKAEDQHIRVLLVFQHQSGDFVTRNWIREYILNRITKKKVLG